MGGEDLLRPIRAVGGFDGSAGEPYTFGTFGDGRRVDPGVADRFDLNEKRFNLPTGMNDAMPLNNIYSILHALKKTNF